MNLFCKLFLFLLLSCGVTLQAFEARLGKLELAGSTARQTYRSTKAVCAQEKLSPDPFVPVAVPPNVAQSLPVGQVQAVCPVLDDSCPFAGPQRARAPPLVS